MKGTALNLALRREETSTAGYCPLLLGYLVQHHDDFQWLVIVVVTLSAEIVTIERNKCFGPTGRTNLQPSATQLIPRIAPADPGGASTGPSVEGSNDFRIPVAVSD